MPCEKTDRVQAHQEVQDWIQNSAGVIGGSQIGGFAGDQEEPEAGGDPGLQYLLLRGVHAGVPTSGAWREPAPLKTKEPQTARRSTKGSGLELFDGIVWRLARDHDIVDVTLTQAGAADANEASLLQELGDGCASDGAHRAFQSSDHLIHDHG